MTTAANVKILFLQESDYYLRLWFFICAIYTFTRADCSSYTKRIDQA